MWAHGRNAGQRAQRPACALPAPRNPGRPAGVDPPQRGRTAPAPKLGARTCARALSAPRAPAPGRRKGKHPANESSRPAARGRCYTFFRSHAGQRHLPMRCALPGVICARRGPRQGRRRQRAAAQPRRAARRPAASQRERPRKVGATAPKHRVASTPEAGALARHSKAR